MSETCNHSYYQEWNHTETLKSEEWLYCTVLAWNEKTEKQHTVLIWLWTPGWFLVIWFDLMPSYIPRHLHEYACRGGGGARAWG